MRLMQAVVLVSVAGGLSGQTCALACDPSRFRDVVSSASAAIAETNRVNGRVLQETLIKLRKASGLPDAEFASRAKPLVQDQVTTSIDAENQAMLAKIQTLGIDTPADASRCDSMLQDLKSLMEKVSANTQTRWQHMLGKVNSASAGPMLAGVAP